MPEGRFGIPRSQPLAVLQFSIHIDHYIDMDKDEIETAAEELIEDNIRDTGFDGSVLDVHAKRINELQVPENQQNLLVLVKTDYVTSFVSSLNRLEDDADEKFNGNYQDMMIKAVPTNPVANVINNLGDQ